MELHAAKKFEALLKCVYNHDYKEGDDAELFTELETKEKHISENNFDPYLMVLYHQLLDKVRHKVIDALIEGLNILLERKEKPYIIDRVYSNIANARLAFNRHELSLVINKATEQFAEFKVCSG